MSGTSASPFQNLTPPPEDAGPQEQLGYLKRVVAAFESTGNPRIKPLGRKLDAALEQLARGAGRGGEPEKLARQFAAEVEALRAQTYDLLLTVVNQVRGTLRIKLQRGLGGAEKTDTERLQKGLALFAQGLRKMVASSKKGDEGAYREGGHLLDEAGKLMNESGRELS